VAGAGGVDLAADVEDTFFGVHAATISMASASAAVMTVAVAHRTRRCRNSDSSFM
jgi:hypothetical protein